jgi:hypothetical protein
MVGEVTPHPVQLDGARTAAFNRVEVRSDAGKTAPVRQEVLWSWTTQGKWQTPRSPRLAFARYPMLCKVYVMRPLQGDKEPAGDEAGADEFLRLLLPEVQKCLFDNP